MIDIDNVIYLTDDHQNAASSNSWITVNVPSFYINLDDSEADEYYNPVEVVPSTFPDGCVCLRCKQHYPYAIPNQPDNITLICWYCKNWI